MTASSEKHAQKGRRCCQGQVEARVMGWDGMAGWMQWDGVFGSRADQDVILSRLRHLSPPPHLTVGKRSPAGNNRPHPRLPTGRIAVQEIAMGRKMTT